MQAVMLSIHPKPCEQIASCIKTIEVRKAKPKIDVPFKCYIYCTQPKYPHEDFITVNAGTENAFSFYGGGKVIGEFICDEIYRFDYILGEYKVGGLTRKQNDKIISATCLSLYEMRNYAVDKDCYGWNISQLKIYDKPKELNEFEIKNDCGGYIKWHKLKRPPQSWCYVEELK